jgi:hypothetical protein
MTSDESDAGDKPPNKEGLDIERTEIKEGWEGLVFKLRSRQKRKVRVRQSTTVEGPRCGP